MRNEYFNQRQHYFCRPHQQQLLVVGAVDLGAAEHEIGRLQICMLPAGQIQDQYNKQEGSGTGTHPSAGDEQLSEPH